MISQSAFPPGMAYLQAASSTLTAIEDGVAAPRRFYKALRGSRSGKGDRKDCSAPGDPPPREIYKEERNLEEINSRRDAQAVRA